MEDILINMHDPFKKDKYSIFKKGIYDNPDIDVYINQAKDFAFLYPQPKLNYDNYKPRVAKLNLEKYKVNLSIYNKRLEKLEKFLKRDVRSILEIGASGGELLELIKGSNIINSTASLLALTFPKLQIISLSLCEIELLSKKVSK